MIALPEKALFIKVEVDTNPPEGAGLEVSIAQAGSQLCGLRIVLIISTTALRMFT